MTARRYVVRLAREVERHALNPVSEALYVMAATWLVLGLTFGWP